jgi:rod shape-determining protein MreC
MMLARTEKEMRQRAPWLFMALLALNFGLMLFDMQRRGSGQPVRSFVQAIASPFQRVFSGVGSTGIGFFQNFSQMRSAAAENEQLRQRMVQMETELNETRIARAENERLKSLLDFKKTAQYEMVAAQVISRDPSSWFNAVIINRGSSSGVQPGMPVVTPNGIVGRVVGTSPWTSQVMLITDEKSAAGAVVGQLGSSNALGAIRGLGNSNLVEMRYVSGLETVNVGDVVLTTGQDKIYPPGLKIGEVAEVTKGSVTTAHTIHIKPGAKLGALSEVTVLLYRPPEQPQMDQTLSGPKTETGSKKQ